MGKRSDRRNDEHLRTVLAQEAARIILHQGIEDYRTAKLKAAENHAKTITDTLRTRRFEPIASQALDLWSRLRLQSNVELTGFQLL